VLNPLAWLCAAWAAFRLIDLGGDLVETRLVPSERHVVTAQMLVPVASLVLKIVLLVGTLFHLMHLFDWDVTAVVTGLGIGGLAFALGAQDSLKNLFGSFTLIADRPFVVGERVKIGNHGEGVVEVVGLRSTRIRTADDALLTVPNSDLTTMHIVNYGRRRCCRYCPSFGVVYGTPPERLLAFRDGLRDLILRHEKARKERVNVTLYDLGASAIEVRVEVYFKVADWPQELAAREELIVGALQLAEALQVEFAFPTQTVHVVPPAGQAALLPAVAPPARGAAA
jgi:MscS family membrane protein